MAKMIILHGLPASGKSTMAEQLLTVGNTVRINKDLLRTMLHFDKWSGRNESMTRDAARKLADWFLTNNVNVIIDDTNLNDGTVQSWKDLARIHNAKTEHERMEVSPEECIKRDNLRDKKVGKHVIQKMALQHLGWHAGDEAVVCDIDGTLADCEHRKHHLIGETKDWHGFFSDMIKDTLRDEVAMAFMISGSQKLKIVVSARPEDYRDITEYWLDKHNVVYDILIMREKGDSRPDTEVKSDIYDKYLSRLKIAEVYDDRPCVIRMWKEKGLHVIDVGNGIEF
jgi:predicted kinase